MSAETPEAPVPYKADGLEFFPGELGNLFYEADGKMGIRSFLGMVRQGAEGLYMGRRSPEMARRDFEQIDRPVAEATVGAGGSGGSLDLATIEYRQLVATSKLPYHVLTDNVGRIGIPLEEHWKRERPVALLEPTCLLSQMADHSAFVKYLANYAEIVQGTQGVLLMSVDPGALEQTHRSALASACKLMASA